MSQVPVFLPSEPLGFISTLLFCFFFCLQNHGLCNPRWCGAGGEANFSAGLAENEGFGEGWWQEDDSKCTDGPEHRFNHSPACL